MINLNVHSCYDFLSSNIQLDALFSKLKADNQRAVAITDFNKMHAIYQLLQKAQQYNIKGIVGMEILVYDGIDGTSIVIYAKNFKGYQELIRLSAMLSYKNLNEAPLQFLKDNLSEVIVIGKSKASISILDELNVNIDDKYVSQHVKHHQYKNAFITPSHYLNSQDKNVLKVLDAIKNGQKLDLKYFNSERGHEYVKTYADLSEQEKALLKVNKEIVEKCHVPIPKTRVTLPTFTKTMEVDSKTLLKQLLEKNFRTKTNQTDVYRKRLEYEYSVIVDMGYEDYFLVVSDAVNTAKSKGIYVGPGRGSSSASLVSYLLNITEVDPIQYDLLFERFLNPERITMPDIDIDFEDTRRSEVVEYLISKYGEMKVSNIGTFGTLSAKMAARDVGRVFQFEDSELKRISNIIGEHVSFKDVLKNDEFQLLVDSDEKYNKYAEIVMSIEGLPRHTSTHAAGVLVSEDKLTEYVPVLFQENHLLSQWPMQEVEAAGLLKIDVLGLKNLSLIHRMVKLIQKKHPNFNIFNIDEEDKYVYQLLKSGCTLGIFQLESDGIRETIKEVSPDSFLDLAAVLSLYRPGPMEQISKFSRIKHGRETVTYLHEDLASILEETYGIIVYQEQIMLIASKIAGYTYGASDILRRAMSKKDRHTLLQEKEKFIQGAIKNRYDQSLAEEIYHLILKFADYGFPKSHAIAYSKVSYMMAFIKVHFKEIFYSVMLSHYAQTETKLKALTDEMKMLNCEIHAPNIHNSFWNNTINNGILLGFNMIKGISYRVAQAIIEERKDRPFDDIYDLKIRLNHVKISARELRALVISGALDEFKENRKTMLLAIDSVSHIDDESDQENLLSALGLNIKKEFQYVEELSQELLIESEKEALGFYISKHPIELLKQEYQYLKFNQLSQHASGEFLIHIKSDRKITTKKGETMAFLRITDGLSDYDAVLFPKQYFMHHTKLKAQNVVIKARKERRDAREQFIIENIILPNDFKVFKLQHTKKVFIRNIELNGIEDILSNHGIPIEVFENKRVVGYVKKQDLNQLIDKIGKENIRLI